MTLPDDFWPDSGWAHLRPDAQQGWLQPTQAYWRQQLQRPELALVEESCAAEMALHQALLAEPMRPVAPAELLALQDEDARENYTVFLRFRDGLTAAGTVEAYYLQLMHSTSIAIPALFIDAMVQAMLRQLLDDCTDAMQWRAAEMLFRPQRVALQSGQMLAGDRATLDMLHETAGAGELGRLLVQGGVPQPAQQMQVLSADNAAQYWATGGSRHFLLDLTHEVTQELSHGLTLKMVRARSGLTALARVLERWIAHLMGVRVRIEPVHQISDSAWRWHVGLDVDSSAILNDLYEGRSVEPERLQRLLSLFTLHFDNPDEMRRDVAGKPVYLGLATDASGGLRLKPQNLLQNLPLATQV